MLDFQIKMDLLKSAGYSFTDTSVPIKKKNKVV